MGNLFSKVDSGSRSSSHSHSINIPSSKWKTLGFAIVIILGIGGLAVAGVGLGGLGAHQSWWQVGALNHLGQFHSIILMSAGSGIGIALLTIGISQSVKHHPQPKRTEVEEFMELLSLTNSQSSTSKDATMSQTSPQRQTQFIEKTSKGEIHGETSFGVEKWGTHFGDVGKVPPKPSINWKAPCPFSGDPAVTLGDTHMLVLIPATVNGKPFTLKTLLELASEPLQGHKAPCTYMSSCFVESECGKVRIENPYWVLLTKDIIPNNLGYDSIYKHQKQVMEYPAYHIPKVLELATCILAEFVVSGTGLYQSDRSSGADFYPCEATTQEYDGKGIATVVFGDAEEAGNLYIYNRHRETFCTGVGVLKRLYTGI